MDTNGHNIAIFFHYNSMNPRIQYADGEAEWDFTEY